MGRRVARTLFLLAAIAVLSSCAFRRNELPPHYGELAGSWEGTFQGKSVKLNGEEVVIPVTLRLVLTGKNAYLFTLEDSKWIELLPNDFEVDYLGKNIMVWKTHAGKIPKAPGSRWYETYIFAGTLLSRDKILFRWVRVVNNLDVGEHNPDRVFTAGGEGVLDRLDIPDGA